MTNPTVFDRNLPFDFHLRRGKVATVSYPTDEMLAQRERDVRVFYTKGSALAQEEGRDEAEDKLIAKILKSGDPECGAEVLGKLLRATPDAPEQTADGYRIPITVVAEIKTIHELREPTTKERRKFSNASYTLGDMRYGKQRAIGNLMAAVEFYDALDPKVEGYADIKSVPANHKAAAIKAMLDQIQSEEEGEDPNSQTGMSSDGPKTPVPSSSRTGFSDVNISALALPIAAELATATPTQ